MARIIEVYDLECMSNLFTYTGYDRTEDKWYQFVIHKTRNDYLDLMKHLFRSPLLMVGYNNLGYDYPLLHHLINHYDEYKTMDGATLASRLYQKSQEIIDMEFSVIADKNTRIPQLDIYKVHHWDNAAKATSLKHCEMAMRMDNIEEMPFNHTYWVTAQDEIDKVLAYNKHDVRATNILLDYTVGKTNHTVYKNKNKIELRQLLSRNFNVNLLNHNDVKIGEDLVFKLYSEKAEVPQYILKKQRTPRPIIHLKDCIPSYVNFKTKIFNNILAKWRNTSITSTKNAISEHVIYHGMALDFGTGGLHGSNSGVFEVDDYWMIIDADVGLKRLN